MNRPPSSAITAIALKFVGELQAGKRPSLEAALDTAPVSEWASLLQSLLIAEVNSRRSRGEVPQPREYLARFPAHADIIRSVLPDEHVPVAAAAIPPRLALPVASPPVPMAIVLPRAFEDFEPPPDPSPKRQRRRRRQRWIGAVTVVILLAAGLVTMQQLGLFRSDAMEPKPEIPLVVGTTTVGTKKIQLTRPGSDAEREFVEWVIAIGGRGTLLLESGARKSFATGTVPPKEKFHLIALTLPAESAGRWTGGDLARFQGRDKLTALQLQRDLTDAELNSLGRLPLRSLDLGGQKIQITAATLTLWPDLETLDLGTTDQLGDRELAAIGQLPRLTTLAINAPGASPVGFRELKNPLLQHVRFGDKMKLTPDHVRFLPAATLVSFESADGMTDAALLELAIFPKLQHLRMNKTSISDAGMKVVLGLGKLEEFRATNSSITALGLEELKERTGLKVLNLAGGKAGNDALPKLIDLVDLRELNLSGCPITDPGVNALARLDALEILDLSGTGITDSALAILKKHQKLTQLIVTGTKITPSAMADFEKSTPNCKIKK